MYKVFSDYINFDNILNPLFKSTLWSEICDFLP